MARGVATYIAGFCVCLLFWFLHGARGGGQHTISRIPSLCVLATNTWCAVCFYVCCVLRRSRGLDWRRSLLCVWFLLVFFLRHVFFCDAHTSPPNFKVIPLGRRPVK